MKDARFARFGDVSPITRLFNRFCDRKCHLVIGDKIGNVGDFPKCNHFNQNLYIKIFTILTSLLVAIKNRFHLLTIKHYFH